MIRPLIAISLAALCSACTPALLTPKHQGVAQYPVYGGRVDPLYRPDPLQRCDKLDYQCRQYEAQRNAQQRAEIARQEQQKRRLGYATQNAVRQACSQATGAYGYCSSGTELGSALFGF